MNLRLSDNRRFLVRGDGAPFFWLGDTAWELFHRLDRAESDIYLQERAAQGFTVVQAVGISEFDGLRTPNRDGELPLHDLDPARPNPAYWKHVDWVLQRGAALGLTLALLPTWGDKWNKSWGDGPEVFTPENAPVHGEWLGRFFRDRPLVWMLGGDRPIENETHRQIMRGMAAGLKAGGAGRHLMTFHPNGGQSSSRWLHGEAWLDFNALQSGHGKKGDDNAALIAHDYALSPAKPCLDAEPRYEDHPVRWNWGEPDKWDASNGYFDDGDARQACYWALFAGAHGHTYGANGVFQFWRQGQADRFGVRLPWPDALHLPGASQMRHARRLLSSRPFVERVPDQSLLPASAQVEGGARATRCENGSYALVYCPSGQPVEVALTKLSGSTVTAHWFDPRSGQAHAIGAFSTGAGAFSSGTREFTPPASGPDWVLVLDDAARNFAAPGTRGA